MLPETLKERILSHCYQRKYRIGACEPPIQSQRFINPSYITWLSVCFCLKTPHCIAGSLTVNCGQVNTTQHLSTTLRAILNSEITKKKKRHKRKDKKHGKKQSLQRILAHSAGAETRRSPALLNLSWELACAHVLFYSLLGSCPQKRSQCYKCLAVSR